MLMRREHERTTSAVAALLGGGFVCAALVYATAGYASDVRTLPVGLLGLLSGLLLLVAAFGLYMGNHWGWKADVVAHVVAIVEALLAMWMLARPGASAAILILLTLSLAALWRVRPRNMLRRVKHRLVARLY